VGVGGGPRGSESGMLSTQRIDLTKCVIDEYLGLSHDQKLALLVPLRTAQANAEGGTLTRHSPLSLAPLTRPSHPPFSPPPSSFLLLFSLSAGRIRDVLEYAQTDRDAAAEALATLCAALRRRGRLLRGQLKALAR
jgi:hypothetical protein